MLQCYTELDPGKNELWQNQQRQFWENKQAFATQAVFDALNGTEALTKWQCRKCGPVQHSNPQSAARISALKKMGYYIATMKMDCATCGGKTDFDLLIRLPRNPADNDRRFSISVSLRKRIETVGSICSGIEAASVAWEPLGLKFKWFSEIAAFPSRVLSIRYPSILNLGDMNGIPHLIKSRRICAPDLVCAGTPCQAFSFAGWKNGLLDIRGNLTLRIVDIINANDDIRKSDGQTPTTILWENVEGVLTDKTNAFGCLVSTLAGLSEIIELSKWPSAGLLRGPKRNIAWRVLDAKFFGIPQQRRRLYLLAGGKDFSPESTMFEVHSNNLSDYPSSALTFNKDGHSFEIFREYTDCLYSAYGTKWNGNAAANNGSLFVVQDGRLRRFSPLECERLMGFPDNYTNIPDTKKTNRYQALGNAWAVPVIHWLGQRLLNENSCVLPLSNDFFLSGIRSELGDGCEFFDFGKGIISVDMSMELNCSALPENCSFCDMCEILSPEAPESIFISPVGCYGIIRRKKERNHSMNARLKEILLDIASQMPTDEIERKSRVQQRSKMYPQDMPAAESLFSQS